VDADTAPLLAQALLERLREGGPVRAPEEAALRDVAAETR
jgi:hypothetical protein